VAAQSRSGATATASPERPAPRATRSTSRDDDAPPVRRYRSERRSPARATLLILVGVIVGIAAIIAIVLSLGGSSKGGSPSSGSSGAEASSSATRTTATHTTSSSTSTSASGTAAGETNVAVLNGTGTTGLAHRVSAELHSQGYSKATALNGKPPGANQATVVEYSSGHQAQAQGVARSLGVSQAQPIEGTVASLAGSATVVVIVGLDKASTSP
jgi:cytoskeletal protein RodZ